MTLILPGRDAPSLCPRGGRETKSGHKGAPKVSDQHTSSALTQSCHWQGEAESPTARRSKSAYLGATTKAGAATGLPQNSEGSKRRSAARESRSKTNQTVKPVRKVSPDAKAPIQTSGRKRDRSRGTATASNGKEEDDDDDDHDRDESLERKGRRRLPQSDLRKASAVITISLPPRDESKHVHLASPRSPINSLNTRRLPDRPQVATHLLPFFLPSAAKPPISSPLKRLVVLSDDSEDDSHDADRHKQKEGNQATALRKECVRPRQCLVPPSRLANDATRSHSLTLAGTLLWLQDHPDEVEEVSRYSASVDRQYCRSPKRYPFLCSPGRLSAAEDLPQKQVDRWNDAINVWASAPPLAPIESH